MSRIYPYLHPNDFVNISRPTGIGSNTEDGIMPVEALLESLFSSGSYEPTISGFTNDISASVGAATYIRVGGIATVSVQLEIIMNEFQRTGSFEVSLPVASVFTNIKQCFGLLQWSYSGNMTEIIGLSIGAEVTNGTCLIVIETLNNGASLQYCTLQFQYEIV